MQQLANVPAVAENFLQVVGDGKWDFSSAASVKGTPRMDVSVKGLLEKYLGEQTVLLKRGLTTLMLSM